jgi:hypothetical protein
MLRIVKRFLLVFFACTLIILAFIIPASANSAEPPSIIILVNNPPEDLSITLISGEKHIESIVRRTAWEGYYAFYSHDMRKDGKHVFRITTGGESFECAIDKPLKTYNNIFTLSLSERKLTPGQYPFRRVLLVSIRLLLTLVLEGVVFWLFRFRQKRSWLVFLAINLVTQGLLNIWLNYGGSPLQSYLVFSLIVGEFFVFLTEMIVFPILVKEQKKGRILLYVFVSNLVSLIAGGYIITVLPV